MGRSFSPLVAPDYPDGLLLDIAGCEHLFGGESGLIQKLTRALQEFGFSARLVAAPTVGCAWAVARYGPDQIAAVPAKNVKRSLAALPVAALRISAEIETALSEVGIERIGQLLDLPHDELAARFGSELLRRLDQASGERQEHIEAIQPAAPRQVTQAFAGPVARLENIRTVVRELLMALMAKLHGEQSEYVTSASRFSEWMPNLLPSRFP